jgi:TrmH family RNA methyltransferase
MVLTGHTDLAMITSVSNPKLKLIRNLQAKRAAREAEGLFVVEGARLIEEAARAPGAPRLALYVDGLDPRAQAALEQLRVRGAALELATTQVMAAASGTETPPGLLAVVPLPVLEPLAPLTLALVLDGLRDPGNLGTILRTADAAGVQAVFLTPGTVDAYNPKVVRAAMGAHFHLPVVALGWDALAQRLAGLALWLAEARAGEAYPRVDWRAPSALMIGSEANGPSQAARRLALGRVSIPMPGRAESLNAAVAAGIILFEAARQRAQSE